MVDRGDIKYFGYEALNDRLLGEIVLAKNVDEKANAQVLLPPDGRGLEQSKYPAIYALIGRTFGCDECSSTFKLPDLSRVQSPVDGQSTTSSCREDSRSVHRRVLTR